MSDTLTLLTLEYKGTARHGTPFIAASAYNVSSKTMILLRCISVGLFVKPIKSEKMKPLSDIKKLPFPGPYLKPVNEIA